MNTFTLNDIKVAGWLKEANYVAGNWVGADDGSTYDVEDPATGTRVGTIPWVSGAETGRVLMFVQN